MYKRQQWAWTLLTEVYNIDKNNLYVTIFEGDSKDGTPIDKEAFLIWKEIVKANEKTSSLEIRKFRMIPKELDHEDGELTATQKIKRNVLMEQFSDLIEEMYS